MVGMKKASSKIICYIFMMLVLVLLLQFNAHGFLASTTTTTTTRTASSQTWLAAASRKSHHMMGRSSSRRQQRQPSSFSKLTRRKNGVHSSPPPWVSNHTDSSSQVAYMSSASSEGFASSNTRNGGTSSVRHGTAVAAAAATAAEPPTTNTATRSSERVVHDLLRQHHEYTSDLVSFRDEIMHDAASVIMTPRLPPLHETGSMMTATAATTTSSSAADSLQETEQDKKDTAVFWARLLLIGAAALYGTNFSLVKLLGETDIPVGLSSTLRFGLAALVTSPWLLLPPPPSKSDDQTNVVTDDERDAAWGATLAGLEVGCWNSIGYVAQAVGLAGATEAGKSAFICSLAVVVVPFLDWITGRALTQREWMGAALALAGVAMLELGDGLQALVGGGADSSSLMAASATSAGMGIGMDDWISLLQPLAFGLGFFRMETAMRTYPAHATRSTAAQLLAVFLASTLYTGVMETDQVVQSMQMASTWLTDPGILMFLFWTGIISTALSIYMETVALKTLSAAETTLILSTEPLWGAAFATAVIGEQFGLNAALGGLFIMGGCLYSSLGSASAAEASMDDVGSSIQTEEKTKTSANHQQSSTSTATKATKREQLESFMASTLSPPLDDKQRQHQQQPQKKASWWRLPDHWNHLHHLSALGVAIAAGVMVAEQHMSVGSRVLSIQVEDLVDGMM